MSNSAATELASLVGELRDDLADAEAKGHRLPVSAAGLVLYYQTLADRFGVDAALFDAKARYARQVACAVDPLPSIKPAPVPATAARVGPHEPTDTPSTFL